MCRSSGFVQSCNLMDKLWSLLIALNCFTQQVFSSLSIADNSTCIDDTCPRVSISFFTTSTDSTMLPCVSCPRIVGKHGWIYWTTHPFGDCPVHGKARWVPNLDLAKVLPGRAFLSIPPDFELKPSTISEAGRGIFTKVHIAANTVFGPYEGALLSQSPINTEYTWALRFDKKLTFYRDGLPINESNWLRWMNSARYEEEQNMIAFQYKENFYYATYKEVEPGSELLLWYGDDYARRLKIPICKRTDLEFMKAPNLTCHKNKEHHLSWMASFLLNGGY